MSKLADAIRRSHQTESNALGFGAARAAPRPTLLVALLARRGADTGGATLVILDGRQEEVGSSDVTAAKSGNGSTIVGAWPGDAAPAKVAELAEAGVDFIVFEPETTPAAALLDENLGYVLALSEAPEESFLRSLEPLSLDAALLPAVPSPLTVSRQLDLARQGLLARKPLACPVSADVSSQDLECLRDAGVAVLLTSDAAAASQVAETVAKLPPHRRRREESRTLSLPRVPAAVAADDEEEEEDE